LFNLKKSSDYMARYKSLEEYDFFKRDVSLLVQGFTARFSINNSFLHKFDVFSKVIPPQRSQKYILLHSNPRVESVVLL